MARLMLTAGGGSPSAISCARFLVRAEIRKGGSRAGAEVPDPGVRVDGCHLKMLAGHPAGHREVIQRKPADMHKMAGLSRDAMTTPSSALPDALRGSCLRWAGERHRGRSSRDLRRPLARAAPSGLQPDDPGGRRQSRASEHDADRPGPGHGDRGASSYDGALTNGRGLLAAA